MKNSWTLSYHIKKKKNLIHLHFSSLNIRVYSLYLRVILYYNLFSFEFGASVLKGRWKLDYFKNERENARAQK